MIQWKQCNTVGLTFSILRSAAFVGLTYAPLSFIARIARFSHRDAVYKAADSVIEARSLRLPPDAPHILSKMRATPRATPWTLLEICLTSAVPVHSVSRRITRYLASFLVSIGCPATVGLTSVVLFGLWCTGPPPCPALVSDGCDLSTAPPCVRPHYRCPVRCILF